MQDKLQKVKISVTWIKHETETRVSILITQAQSFSNKQNFFSNL